jgi:hypothetical protein
MALAKNIKIGDIAVSNGFSPQVIKLYKSYNAVQFYNTPKLLDTNIFGTVAGGTQLGTIQKIDEVNEIIEVQLSFVYLDNLGFTVNRAFVKTADITTKPAPAPTNNIGGQKYWAKQDVNVRTSPKVLATTVKTVALKGDFLGYSTGKNVGNNFAEFLSNTGGKTYVGISFITSTPPTNTTPRANSNGEVVINNKKTNNQLFRAIGIGFLAITAVYLFFKNKQYSK